MTAPTRIKITKKGADFMKRSIELGEDADAFWKRYRRTKFYTLRYKRHGV